jgi:type IV pilus assembly protein PilA
MIQKGFTLIELLVVVAIIGILAAVGTPIFQGFLLDAKITSTQAQHQNAASFISNTFTRCAMGAKTQKVQWYSGEVDRNCSDTDGQWMSHFTSHFDVSNWENPYTGGANGGKPAEMVGRCNPNKIKGVIAIMTFRTCGIAGNGLRIRTNIGDSEGNDKYISRDVLKE